MLHAQGAKEGLVQNKRVSCRGISIEYRIARLFAATPGNMGIQSHPEIDGSSLVPLYFLASAFWILQMVLFEQQQTRNQNPTRQRCTHLTAPLLGMVLLCSCWNTCSGSYCQLILHKIIHGQFQRRRAKEINSKTNEPVWPFCFFFATWLTGENTVSFSWEGCLKRGAPTM